jgi:hypothetical protein
MGLSIMHYKLTHTPNSNGEYFSVDLIEECCNLGSEPYLPFMKEIEVEEGGRTTLVMGVWYEEVGCRRKGMSKEFYEHFDHPELCFWGRKEDFEFAGSCVMADEFYEKTRSPETILEAEKNFKENFVDSFVFGQSLMWISF